jgi:hypothetical protein
MPTIEDTGKGKSKIQSNSSSSSSKELMTFKTTSQSFSEDVSEAEEERTTYQLQILDNGSDNLTRGATKEKYTYNDNLQDKIEYSRIAELNHKYRSSIQVRNDNLQCTISDDDLYLQNKG